MRRFFLATILISAAILSSSAQSTNPNRDPATALWLSIKEQLTGPDAQSWFDKNLKDAKLPVLFGKLASATPADRPNTLTLLMPEGENPEATLHLKDERGKEDHYPGPLAIGSTISFEGAGVSFEKQPLMLVFDVYTEPK